MMSFFLVRLLQTFAEVELDTAAQPIESRPPSEWRSAPGRKGADEVTPKMHLILYVQVSVLPVDLLALLSMLKRGILLPGRSMGQNGGGGGWGGWPPLAPMRLSIRQ